MAKITWKLTPMPGGGWVGTMNVPLPAGWASAKVSAAGDSKALALGRAAAIADKVVSNPIVSALLPPQAGIALKATKFLAKSAAGGQLASAAKKLAGPGMKRLGKVFGF